MSKQIGIPTLYPPGSSDYPANAPILYLPSFYRVTPIYKNGSFSEFGQVYFQAGSGADGANYYWYRAFFKFNICPLWGRLLSVCEIKWLLASKAFAGSGYNAQLQLRLHAIDDYGTPDKDDWGMAIRVNYEAVNLYGDAVGVVYSKDVKTRIQALIDTEQYYAAFRFLTLGAWSNDLCNGGTATGYNTYGGTTPANAFDNNAATGWMSNVQASWLKYQLTAAKVIQKYTIRVGGTAGRTPNTWVFQGSNNNVGWTTLDSRSGITWSLNEKKEFTFSNSTAYLYYRILTSINNNDLVVFVEVEMMEYDPNNPPSDANNANNYRITEALLYCEF